MQAVGTAFHLKKTCIIFITRFSRQMNFAAGEEVFQLSRGTGRAASIETAVQAVFVCTGRL
jgi:hypothetical protein